MIQMSNSKKEFLLYFLKGEVACVGEKLFKEIIEWCEVRDFDEDKIQLLIDHVKDLGSDSVVVDLIKTITEFFYNKQPTLNNYYTRWANDETYTEYFS